MTQRTRPGDIFFPDSTVTAPPAREICAHINRYSLRNDFPEAQAYLASLTDDDFADIAVTQHAVSLYISEWDYVRADDLLERVRLPALLSTADALLDEDVAVLALAAAWIRCRRSLSIDAAVTLVQEIDGIYMSQDLDPQDHSPNMGDKIERITRQRQIWQLPDPTTYDDSLQPLTDTRIAIEDFALHILWMACCAGKYQQQHISRRMKERFIPIIRYLSARGRRLSHAMAMFLCLPLLASSVGSSNMWQDYLEGLIDQDMSIVKARVQSLLIKYLGTADTETANEHFLEAAATFKRENCARHGVDLLLNFWRIDTSRTSPRSEQWSSLLECSTRSKMQVTGTNPSVQPDLVRKAIGSLEMRAQQRFDSLSDIYQRSLDCQHIGVQSHVINEAIELAKNKRSLWSSVRGFMKSTLAQLRALGDTFEADWLQSLYYLETAEILDGAEEARIYFEKILANRELASVPILYLRACKGMWRACTKLSDPQKALEYALMDMDLSSRLKLEDGMTAAAWRIATSRTALAERQIAAGSLDQRLTTILRTELDDVVNLLETWIDSDKQAGRTSALEEKSSALEAALLAIISLDKDNISKEEHVGHLLRHRAHRTETGNVSSFPHTTVYLDLQTLRHMIREKRFADAARFCDSLHQKVLEDEKLSLAEASSLVTAVVASLHALKTLNPLPLASDEERKALLARQRALITSDLKALRLTCSESFLCRARPFTWIILDCLKLWPESTEEFVVEIAEYFNQAQEICQSGCSRITSRTSIQQWLCRRDVLSLDQFKTICQTAAEFFLKTKLLANAWAWIQRSRTQALQEILRDRATASKRLLMTFENTPGMAKALSEEERLVRGVEDADSTHFFDAVQDLARHRESMRSAPVLQQLVGGLATRDHMNIDQIDDIWELHKFLPNDCHVVLVDWFVDTWNALWRLDYDSSKRHLGIEAGFRWTKGYITLDRIKAWKKTYLEFSPGEVWPLEYRFKALHQLRSLLTGLNLSCRPGDLIIVSTPGELSGIPIHGIPFDGSVMIERNPVVYSGGLSLFRQCLERANERRLSPMSSFLRDAVFASAYEQRGYEAEQAAIFSHLESTANLFRSKRLLGHSLTVNAVHGALRTASWIHYHGHAYYAKTEPLNQCLVLGRLSDQELSTQPRAPNATLESLRGRLEAEMPFETLLSDRETLLSGHLLEGSSRLTVADVFAMDLTATSPVVINVACDSGVQEFSPGNDPLGLVSALFCAGASSIVGTLWPIRSSSGRAFSRAFYDSLALQDGRQRGGEAAGLRHHVNLAFAFRDAVLAIKKIRPDPYSWAAFTLQGAPMYFYSTTDAKGGSKTDQ